MTTLTRSALGLLLLPAALALASVWLPNTYVVERSVVVNTRPGYIFPLVNNLESWQQWTPISREQDPSLVYYYTGPEAGIGSQQAWRGNTAGQGQLKITASETNKEIAYDLELEQGLCKGNGFIQLLPEQTVTKVTWRTETSVGNNPIDKYRVLLRQIGSKKAAEQGLLKLKTVAEQYANLAQARNQPTAR